jgi:hypothetical protein
MQRFNQAPEPWHSFLGELDREAKEETRLDHNLICFATRPCAS